ncbi:MAG: hypothetical protein IJ607_09465 [Bacteroidaceae bacterium]|nr:hypothetical protein [Bacteroidaceae bacterium]
MQSWLCFRRVFDSVGYILEEIQCKVGYVLEEIQCKVGYVLEEIQCKVGYVLEIFCNFAIGNQNFK